jgi:hypothetical protein
VKYVVNAWKSINLRDVSSDKRKSLLIQSVRQIRELLFFRIVIGEAIDPYHIVIAL